MWPADREAVDLISLRFTVRGTSGRFEAEEGLSSVRVLKRLHVERVAPQASVDGAWVVNKPYQLWVLPMIMVGFEVYAIPSDIIRGEFGRRTVVNMAFIAGIVLRRAPTSDAPSTHGCVTRA